MGSNVPPMIPTRPPATERAYPGPPEPAPEDRPRPPYGGDRPGDQHPPDRATGSPVQPVAVRAASLRWTVPAATFRRHRAVNARRKVRLRPGAETADGGVHTARPGRQVARSTSDRIDKVLTRQAVPSTSGPRGSERGDEVRQLSRVAALDHVD